ncbi:MAG: PilZ domain-containing protein [Hydrogenophilales bacterium]|nr:PilZ domain-containing protein [Hydrogenophilales bacterium]
MSEARLAVESHFAFTWRPLTEALDARTLRGNRLLLRSINATESSVLEAHPDRLHERLETKLDLALHWLGGVLYAGTVLPPARTLRLDAEGLAWEESAAPALGSQVRLTLYPNPGLAAPLELAGEIVEAGGSTWLRARLLDRSEEWQDEWTQWLFRLHRRTIQAARK